jgi:hypothetical protein
VSKSLFFVALVAAFVASPVRIAYAQTTVASDDSLRHGHALLVGNSHYDDSHWPPLDDVPLQLEALQSGLRNHFDTVDIVKDLAADKLLLTISSFL